MVNNHLFDRVDPARVDLAVPMVGAVLLRPDLVVLLLDAHGPLAGAPQGAPVGGGGAIQLRAPVLTLRPTVAILNN